MSGYRRHGIAVIYGVRGPRILRYQDFARGKCQWKQHFLTNAGIFAHTILTLLSKRYALSSTDGFLDPLDLTDRYISVESTPGYSWTNRYPTNEDTSHAFQNRCARPRLNVTVSRVHDKGLMTCDWPKFTRPTVRLSSANEHSIGGPDPVCTLFSCRSTAVSCS